MKVTFFIHARDMDEFVHGNIVEVNDQFDLPDGLRIEADLDEVAFTKDGRRVCRGKMKGEGESTDEGEY